MTTTSIATVGKNELLQRARDFGNKTEADNGFPYKEAVREESDFFVGMLENAKDGTLSEIRDSAIATAASSAKKANIAALGGMGLVIASFLVPLPPAASLLRLGGIVAGFYVSNVVAGKAGREAAEQKKFASQLTEWETALAAGTSAPQPTPAPAPAPAPQPAPAQP